MVHCSCQRRVQTQTRQRIEDRTALPGKTAPGRGRVSDCRPFARPCPGFTTLELSWLSARPQSRSASFQPFPNWELRSCSIIPKMTRCRKARYLAKHLSRRQPARRLASASLRVTCLHSTTSNRGHGRDLGPLMPRSRSHPTSPPIRCTPASGWMAGTTLTSGSGRAATWALPLPPAVAVGNNCSTAGNTSRQAVSIETSGYLTPSCSFPSSSPGVLWFTSQLLKRGATYNASPEPSGEAIPASLGSTPTRGLR